MKTHSKGTLAKSNQNRLWAIWIWNRNITETEMLRQLGEFAERGFAGVAVRPGRDMRPAYLSEEFFVLFDKMLHAAKEAGIGVKIADDLSVDWTGVFHREAETNVALRAQKLILEHNVVVSPKDTFDYPISAPDLYYAMALKIVDGKTDAGTVKHIAIAAKAHSISWKIPTGDWRIMIFRKTWQTDVFGSYLPNMFNPKAAHAYSQLVLDRFVARFEKLVPSVLNGFICEMPSIMPTNGGIPWDDDLVIKYRSRYKKEILDAIPALFIPVDDLYAKNRAHVYNFIAQSIYERFPAILETWAIKTRMSQWVLTPERDLADSPAQLTDLFAIPQAQIAVAGIQAQEGTDAAFSTLKAVADMNALEYRRETVAVIGRTRTGQAASIQSLKNEIDLCATVGIQHLLLDGCWFNIDRRSHFKTPYNHSWYHPEWPWMRELCEHACAMTSLATTLILTRTVALVMPYSSAMADYLPDNGDAHRRAMVAFRKAAAELRALNVEFDIVSEQYLLTCNVKNEGTFAPAGAHPKLRKADYSTIIFPYARLINNSVFVFLEKLAAKSGTIVFIGEAPQGSIDDGQNPSFTARVLKLIRQKNGSAHVISTADLGTIFEETPRTVQAAVAGKPCADIIVTSATSTQGYDVYLLHNQSDKRDYSALVEIAGAKHVYYADLATEELHEFPEPEITDEFACVEIDFSPLQTSVIVTSATRLGATHAHNLSGFLIPGMQRQYRLVAKDRWPFAPISPNVMALAAWNTKMGLVKEQVGFFHFHETAFDIDQKPESCVLSLDAAFTSFPGDIEVMVNGVSARLLTGDLVERFGEGARSHAGARLNYDVMDSLTGGTNRISIRTSGTATPPSPLDYPPMLLGAFSLRKGPRGWMIDLPQGEVSYGSWTTGGYPYLTGYGEYQQVVELPSEYQKLILRLSGISGAAKLKINDKEVGIATMQPAAFDVTALVEPKRNTFTVTVASTSDNMIRMNGRAAGLTGEVYLDIY